MLKLIQLEIRKNKLGGMLKGVAIANAAILAFMLLITYIDSGDGGGEFKTYAEMYSGVYIFVKATFLVYASVVLSKLVIEEYKNNTITLLFMYPISRKKLMGAKIIIVFLFTLISIFVSNILVIAALTGINAYTHVIPGQPDWSMIPAELIRIGADAVYAAGIGLIPLYIGMRKKSVPATIVTAVLLVSLISSGSGNYQLGNQVGVSIFLSLLGAGIACLSIRNIEQQDIA
ncbi:ABC transporter permease [Paenibacillus sp. S150]|uniref:ABC transporter permease n=1 Tax=Paenibacillus sp. S150 TaxID=2749826 RepID=UPI001C5947CB|nr:ABC transporter permease [Paenibacillus sp. S150]MBW4083848.1 ABC transporter permease [Paenibacillus sp. S150]